MARTAPVAGVDAPKIKRKEAIHTVWYMSAAKPLKKTSGTAIRRGDRGLEDAISLFMASFGIPAKNRSAKWKQNASEVKGLFYPLKPAKAFSKGRIAKLAFGDIATHVLVKTNQIAHAGVIL